MVDDVAPHLPHPSADDEIHPGDFVVLIEGDPYLVGNHPCIVDAFLRGTHGRVCRLYWKALSAFESKAIGKTSDYEVAVEFPGAPKLFAFWKTFLKKIKRPVDVTKT